MCWTVWNLQTLKPVQFCTGSIFCTFCVITTTKYNHQLHIKHILKHSFGSFLKVLVKCFWTSISTFLYKKKIPRGPLCQNNADVDATSRRLYDVVLRLFACWEACSGFPLHTCLEMWTWNCHVGNIPYMSRNMRFPTIWYVQGYQQRIRPACAYAQSDQNLSFWLDYYMTLRSLTQHHLEFLSLKEGCKGSSESILVKIPQCWKSHVAHR